MGKIEIASIPKNSREEIRVCIDQFQGHPFMDFRVWFEADSGEMKPSKKGIAVPIRLLHDFSDALELGIHEARCQGLLKTGEVIPFVSSEVVEF